MMDSKTMRNERLKSKIFDPFVAAEPRARAVPGSHEINMARSGPSSSQPTSPSRSTVAFDPILSQVVWNDNAPVLPAVTDSLNPFRRLDSRQKDKE
jgi:hypothetical protein